MQTQQLNLRYLDTIRYKGYSIRIYAVGKRYTWKIFDSYNEFVSASSDEWRYMVVCHSDAENYIDSQLND